MKTFDLPLPRLLISGNRTNVVLFEEKGSLWIQKELRSFADVETERRALYREAWLQSRAPIPGVVPIRGGRLDPLTPLTEAHTEQGEFRQLLRPYIPGASLRELLLRATQEPAVSAELRRHAFTWSAALAQILATLHSGQATPGLPRGFIHRDVTIDNVLVDPAGKIWLNDFGLAFCDEEGPLSDSQLLQGAKHFLPPEVREGAQPTDRSDVYQTARLTLLLLDPHAELASSEQPTDLPEPLRAALAPDPRLRPTMRELARELRALDLLGLK